MSQNTQNQKGGGLELLGVALLALIVLFLWGRTMTYLAGE